MQRSTFLGTAAAAGTVAVGFPNIARAQVQTVRVGTLNILSDAPFIVTQAKNFWKDEGLTVESTVFQSAGDMIVPMTQDALDSGGGTIAAGLYNGVSRGLTVRAVASKGTDAPLYGSDKLLVRTDLVKSGRFKTIKDLKGMTVAGNEPGAGSSAALWVLLQKYGMDWADISRQNLAFPNHVAALENGKVDAAYTAEPFATIAEKSGAATVIQRDDQWYPNQQLSVVLFSGDFMKKRAELAHRFMRGYLRGARFYYNALKDGKFNGPNGAEVVGILNDVIKPPDKDLYKQVTAIYLSPDARLELASVKRDLDYFRKQNIITSPTIGVADVIEETFLNQAVKELGPMPRSKA
jgi:NitT/TauT family transport system substrate-binding protein